MDHASTVFTLAGSSLRTNPASLSVLNASTTRQFCGKVSFVQYSMSRFCLVVVVGGGGLVLVVAVEVVVAWWW